MDESNMPENCVILSPEELARLGVNIDKLTTASDKQSITDHEKEKSERINKDTNALVTKKLNKSCTSKSKYFNSVNQSASPKHKLTNSKKNTAIDDQRSSEMSNLKQSEAVLTNNGKEPTLLQNVNDLSKSKKLSSSSKQVETSSAHDSFKVLNSTDSFVSRSLRRSVTSSPSDTSCSSTIIDRLEKKTAVEDESIKNQKGDKKKILAPTEADKAFISQINIRTKKGNRSMNQTLDDELNVIDKDEKQSHSLKSNNDFNDIEDKTTEEATNKTKTFTLIEDESLLIDSLSTASPVRKRGRPKKILNNEQTNESLVSQITEKERKKAKSIADDLDSDNDDYPLEQLEKRRKFGNKRKLISSSDSDNDECKNKTSNNNESKNNELQKLAANNSNIEKPALMATETDIEHPKTKRKRGRPKKNTTEPSAEKSKPEIDYIIGTSGRGRKRKQINYSLLENSSIESSDDDRRVSTNRNRNSKNKLILSNDSDNEEYKSGLDLAERNSNIDHDSPTVIKIESEQLITAKKRGRPRKNATGTQSKSSELEIAHTIEEGRKIKEVNNSLLQNTSIESSDDDHQISRNKNHKNSLKELNSAESFEKEENNLEGSNLPVEEQNSEGVKNSKYKWTGNTTKTLKQIFSLLQGNNAEEVSDDALSGLNKRKQALAKHNKDFLLNENETSICMVCNESINNGEWNTHKMKEHYNLTWRKGEAPMDVSNSAVIQTAFTDLRKQQGYLKCNKCGKRISQIKTFINHLDICNGVVDSSGCITCAVCQLVMEKKEWAYHKYKQHNNLAWREGDLPLNLQDQDLVVRILTQLYKAKKPLHCEFCRQQKKSVLGYLSHKSVCQVPKIDVEKVKVACKLCGKKVLPVSMDYHLKSHATPLDLLSKSGYFNVDVNNRQPRRAAMQALKVIKSAKGDYVDSSKYYINQCNFDDHFVITELKKRMAECPDLSCIFTNCEFQTTYLEIMVQHLNSCDQKPDQYVVCKLCLTWCNEENEIKDHIKEVHKIIRTNDADKDAEYDYESEHYSDEDQFIQEMDMEKRKLVLKGKMNLMNNQRVKPMFLIHPIGERLSTLVYTQAYPWMFNFCEKNYANLNLFETLRNNRPWQVLDCDILNDYLPRHHESCDITVKMLNAKEKLSDINGGEFKKLGLFEICNFYKGEATIYCGGPVTALSWLPTPCNQENQNQILAVAVLNEGDKEYIVGQTYNEPHILQFWKIGQLYWHQVKDCEIKPSLLYGLALTTGPIWHLEWCPSGCLDLAEGKDHSRLGLLAVATSDSFAYIYCIDTLEDENDRGLIYKGEPVVKLQLEAEKSATEPQYYATRISWTKAAGHRYIAVGYSTGIIALFDLLSTSDLLKKKVHMGTQIILPYQTIQGHLSCITALTLGHFGNGNRWCFSAAFDKTYTFWDLSNVTKLASHRKYGASDGLWPTLWPVCLLAEDESSFSEAAAAHTLVKPIRDVTYPELTNFTLSPSGINSVSFSDWLNLIMHGSNAGDVFGQFAHRICFYVDNKQLKKSYTKCVFSVTKLIRKDESEDLTSITYDEAITNYKIAFIDYNSDELSNIPNSKNNEVNIGIEKYNIHDYPLQAVSRIAVNPNPQSCTFYAAGYQAGFIRIRAMEVLSSNFTPETFPGYDFSGSL